MKRIIIISIILGLTGVSCLLTRAFPKLAKSVPTPTATEVVIVIPEITLQPTVIISDQAITITFTEQDVQGWINSYQASNPDTAITDPVVVLDNGLCTITGNFQSGFIKGDVKMTFSVSLDQNSTPLVTIQTLQLGGMDVPDSIKQSFDAAINQSIANSLTSGLEGRTIQSISIEDHLITIVASN
jgi:hypothetical protein